MRIKTNFKTLLATTVLTVALLGTAEATLNTIGLATYNNNNYNLIWDDDSPFGSIVWLDYSNPGQESNEWPGPTSFEKQLAWATNLNADGVLTYLINPSYSVSWTGNWRLPNIGAFTPNQYSYEVNNTNSELGHLYYTELGNHSRYNEDSETWGLVNSGPFDNLQSYYYFFNAGGWSGTFDFGFNDGIIRLGSPNNNMLGLAACNAQVETTPVPEPSTVLFLGGGLAILLFLRRKSHKVSRLNE